MEPGLILRTATALLVVAAAGGLGLGLDWA